jgi:hypothetical protein
MGLFDLKSSAAESFRLMVDDADAFLRQVVVPRASNIQFQVEGVLFQAEYVPQGDGIKLQFWASLGYLPYSIESAPRRQMLIAILENLHNRGTVQFGINDANEIIVAQTFMARTIRLPDYIFIPLVAFLQEALPPIRLIGECL